MTKSRVLIAFLASGLLVTSVHAHSAPREQEYEERLLHDCIDDAGGGDAISFGYDLHSLDVREWWDGSQEQMTFRVILNGNGQADITLQFRAQGETQTFTWSTNDGNSWTTTGFDSGGRVNNVLDGEGNPDAGRFAIEGTVMRASVGAIGDVIDLYTLNSQAAGADDGVPGYDGFGSDDQCEQPYQRADYALTGPDGFASLKVDSAIGLLADSEQFVDVRASNLLQRHAQEAMLSIIDQSGDATIRFHDPDGSGDGYSDEVTLDLGKRGAAGSQKLIHLAVNGDDGDAGTVTIELTTDLGGRVVEEVPYSVHEPDTPSGDDDPPTGGDDEGGKGIPSIGPVAVLSLLALAAAGRR